MVPPGTATTTASAFETSPPPRPSLLSSCPSASHRFASPPQTLPLPTTAILISLPSAPASLVQSLRTYRFARAQGLALARPRPGVRQSPTGRAGERRRQGRGCAAFPAAATENLAAQNGLLRAVQQGEPPGVGPPRARWGKGRIFLPDGPPAPERGTPPAASSSRPTCGRGEAVVRRRPLLRLRWP
jgi:hypothetical protein